MTLDKSAARIRQMFGQIAAALRPAQSPALAGHRSPLAAAHGRAGRAGRGRPWILDVCTGTADLALAYARAGGPDVRIVGSDFCRPMLAVAGAKCRRAGAAGHIALVEADTLQLPFPDGASTSSAWPSGCAT